MQLGIYMCSCVHGVYLLLRIQNVTDEHFGNNFRSKHCFAIFSTQCIVVPNNHGRS